MSTDRTGALTRRALEAEGLSVAETDTLRDVDELEDAHACAHAAPGSHFAAAFRDLAVLA